MLAVTIAGAVAGALFCRFAIVPLFRAPPAYGEWIAARRRESEDRARASERFGLRLTLLYLLCAVAGAAALIAVAHGVDAVLNAPARNAAAYAMGVDHGLWLSVGGMAGLFGLGVPLYVPIAKALLGTREYRRTGFDLGPLGLVLLFLPCALVTVLELQMVRSQTLFFPDRIRDTSLFSVRATERSYSEIVKIVVAPEEPDETGGWVSIVYAGGQELDLRANSMRYYAFGRPIGLRAFREGVLRLISEKSVVRASSPPPPTTSGDTFWGEFLLAFLASVIALYGIAQVWRWISLRGLVARWQAIATGSGYRFRVTRDLPSLEGTVRSIPFTVSVGVEVTYGRGGGTRNYYFDCSLTIQPRALPPGFAARATGWFDRVLPRGKGTVSSGDQAFDRRVTIYCEDRRALPGFLTPERKRCLVEAVVAGAVVLDGCVRYRDARIPSSASELEKRLVPLADAAVALAGPAGSSFAA